MGEWPSGHAGWGTKDPPEGDRGEGSGVCLCVFKFLVCLFGLFDMLGRFKYILLVFVVLYTLSYLFMIICRKTT